MALSAQNQLYHARVRDIEDIGGGIRIIRLSFQEPFDYKAGQFINISFNGLPERPYSIASAPGGETMDIHIKRGKGPASAYAFDHLMPGEEITYTGPDGDNWYDESYHDPVIALAGGLGIAPIKAITEQAMKADNPRSFTLYWGTFSEEERYLDGYFKALDKQNESFHYRPVTGAHVGDIALNEIGSFADFQIFVSGPPAMITDLVPRLLERGADDANLSYDRHPEAAEKATV